MSSEILTPEESPRELATPGHHQQARTPRVLACILCQQRKVKCDRKFPCSNCTKAGAQCVSAALVPRQRRRRFPERELLHRLRHYEHLLRQNKIPFEPLHSEHGTEHMMPDGVDVQPQSTESTNEHPETPYEIKNFWDAMNRQPQRRMNDYCSQADDDGEDHSDGSSDVLREKVVKTAWDSLYDNSDHLLFCSRNMSIDLLSLHPNQIHIFKIWQVYLENFDPLLKVTHTPTLQARIIDAASDLANVDPCLEALMFSIYCVSIFSLGYEECLKLFGASREDLLTSYQLGAREALLNCRFLRTGDREVLTALHFYLMTVKPVTDPRALASTLGTTIRIAQRMAIHDESANKKYPALEAELRRRLWWSIVLFDARISEMTDFRLGLLLPTWDCKPPLNANDFDYRPEMKLPPEVHGMTSEAIFAVVRAELGDFTRHSAFHLEFTNPALKSVARNQATASDGDDLATLERTMEEKYLRYCDTQNPLQFMTLWWARGQLAKTRFISYLAQGAIDPASKTESQLNTGIMHALAMLEYDTKIMSSNHSKKFRWLTYLNFPFPAYVHIVHDLRKRPNSAHAPTAWNIMSENCAARFTDIEDPDKFMVKRGNPFFKIFAGVVFQAWNAREAAVSQAGLGPLDPPSIVTQIRERLAALQASATEDTSQSSGFNADIMLGTHFTSPYRDFGNVDAGVFSAVQDQADWGLHWGWNTPHLQSMMGRGW